MTTKTTSTDAEITALFTLSLTAENQKHPAGAGFRGMGVSQTLAGTVGDAKTTCRNLVKNLE